MKNTVFCICIPHNRYDLEDIASRDEVSDDASLGLSTISSSSTRFNSFTTVFY